MPSLSIIAQDIVVGIVNGSLYVVLALGLTLLFGVSRIINLAHGQFFAIGGYLMFYGIVRGGLPTVLVIAAIFCAGLAGGWIVNRGLIAPIRARPNIEFPLELFLILTLGLSMFLQNGLLVVFGDNPQRVPTLVEGSFSKWGVIVLYEWLVVVGASAVVTCALLLFLKTTRLGTAIRATSQDRNAAQTVGIDVARMDSVSFGLATGLGLAAGAIAAPILLVYPSLGVDWLLKAIVVVILGGLGSVGGALIAGYGLGIIESVSTLALPAQYSTSVGLLLMVAILMVRPAGLLGRRIEGEL